MPGVEHVVIIVKENHTFDNYFGGFPGANGKSIGAVPDPADDPRHDHETCLRALNGTGGVQASYSDTDIGAYWSYAREYTLCDNYFTDVASQSEPNHLYTFAAHSPIIDNASKSRTYQPQPPYDLYTLPQALEEKQLTWKHYSGTDSSYFEQVTWLKGKQNNVDISQFDADAAADGGLASVSWLFAPSGLSEHPGDRGPDGNPAGPAPGMNWTVDRISAVRNGPSWQSSAIFVTWDDWGGWYDHVLPPNHEPWPGDGPVKATIPYRNSQFRFGYRVPCLVIGPSAKAQHVESSFYSHVSLVKFCIRLFSLKAWDVPALAKDDPSGDMWECFNF